MLALPPVPALPSAAYTPARAVPERMPAEFHADTVYLRVQREAMLRVPDVVLAGIHLGPVWFTSRPDAKFEKFMSSMTAGPVEGSLGGNALASVELTVDYVRARAWIEPGRHRSKRSAPTRGHPT